MKFQFDLLPQEYKSLPRDIFGMVLAVIAIVVSISWTLSLSWRNTSAQADLQGKIDKAEDALREVRKQMNAIAIPTGKVNEIRSQIQFINKNLDTPGSTWVDFLFAFEARVPEQVYIRDLNPKTLTGPRTTFSITGQARDLNLVLGFVRRLQEDKRFSNVFLKQNSEELSGQVPLTNFLLDFTYAVQP